MVQHIDTIGIEYLRPFYIKKEITEKTGIFKNKTNVVEKNVDLDYDKMKSRGYPVSVMEYMTVDFKHEKKWYSNPRIGGIHSVEFTLNQFIQQHQSCKIISMIRDGDYRLCIVWERL